MISLDYIRPIIHQVHWNQRLVSIRGARGVGKTTLLLQYIKQTYGDNPKEAIYVSLDNLYFSRHTFLEFVDDFYKMGGKSKDGKQIANLENAFIAADGIEHPFGNKIPLWCFGFLY